MQVNLHTLHVRPVIKSEEAKYRELMKQPTTWVICPRSAIPSGMSPPMARNGRHCRVFPPRHWKCGARDRWIGWDFRHQYDRLNLIANNSRFLILPEWHYPNLGSKALSLCHQRIAGDWQEHFGQPLLLLETFVDPARFHGTVYRAANWTCLGLTRGFRRTREGYSSDAPSPELVFVLPVQRDARAQLSRSILDPAYRTGAPKIMLTAQQMRTLPDFFNDIPDPRRAEGKRHRLSVVLGIAAGAVMTRCGGAGGAGMAAMRLLPQAAATQ